jgi:putative hydrolase of the HAD superfamily
MKKKAIIFDLDNTIYLVSSIGQNLFKSLFQLIIETGEYKGDLNELKSEIMRRPFQFVADDFSFSESLKSKCLDLLSDLTYEEKIESVEGFNLVREMPCKKFLVTTGFKKLQESKIHQLGLIDDFDSISIIDPSSSNLTKRDIFEKILIDNNYQVEEVLVIGDDLNSEIKAAKDLGIESVLYNYKSDPTVTVDQKTIRNFNELYLYI